MSVLLTWLTCLSVLLCQFMDRLQLLLMPAKHQPDLIYLRHVPQRRIHLFTFIQGLCLALLWILKSTVAAIIFPVMVRNGCNTKHKRTGLYLGMKANQTISLSTDLGAGCRSQGDGLRVLPAWHQLPGLCHPRERQEEERGGEEEEKQEEGKQRQWNRICKLTQSVNLNI